MTQMIRVPASKIASVPLGVKDKITQVNLSDFQIGKAEVTGALWSDVYNWAVTNGYTFEENTEYKNVGTDKPVAGASWYDMIVWTNAYSEKSKLHPVYQSGASLWFRKRVLKDATDTKALDKAQIVLSKDIKKRGYQLLTKEQWELAARWLGTKKPVEGRLATEAISTKGKDKKTTYYWSPQSYASGATDNVDNKNATARVAWFFPQDSAKTVCTKASNVLKICDMSGNVWELQFTANAVYGGGVYRSKLGGSWDKSNAYLTVSNDNISTWSGGGDWGIGFRLARTAQ